MDAKHINALIRLADKFDQEKKFELAEAVDRVLKSKAARPKAPLKGLNDDVKKSLIVFLVDAEDAMHKGCKGLGELSRRMRYFDISDAIKELGLDKVIKDMEKTQECLDSAKKDFYTMTFGKRPSKADFERLREELGKKEDDADDNEVALDFFNSDQAIDSSAVNLKEDMEDLSDDEGDDKEVVEEKEVIEEKETDDGRKVTTEKETVKYLDSDDEEISDAELEEFLASMNNEDQPFEEENEE